MLPYTLCFIKSGSQILMLKRRFAPNEGLWNGVGGKIEPGEKPHACIIREVQEETGIILSVVRFGGIVTWEGAPETGKSGMYVYTANFLDADPRPLHLRDTSEGMLAWMDIKTVCDRLNRTVVSNISQFLPPMLQEKGPDEFFCQYRNGGLWSVTQSYLPWEIRRTATEVA